MAAVPFRAFLSSLRNGLGDWLGTPGGVGASVSGAPATGGARFCAGFAGGRAVVTWERPDVPRTPPPASWRTLWGVAACQSGPTPIPASYLFSRNLHPAPPRSTSWRPLCADCQRCASKCRAIPTTWARPSSTASFRGGASKPRVSTSRRTAWVQLIFGRWATAAPSPWPTMPTRPNAPAIAAWCCAGCEPGRQISGLVAAIYGFFA